MTDRKPRNRPLNVRTLDRLRERGIARHVRTCHNPSPIEPFQAEEPDAVITDNPSLFLATA